jgi:hypothetical protein
MGEGQMSSLHRIMGSALAALAVLLAVLSSQAFGQSLKEQIVGTWRLVTWSQIVDGVERVGPFGADAIGQHIFTSDGHLCFAIMTANRPKFASPNYLAATAQEKAAGFDSYSSYCGRYQIDEQERSMLVQVDVSLFPNFTGAALKRFGIEATANSATFKIMSGTGGKNVINVFVWERAK